MFNTFPAAFIAGLSALAATSVQAADITISDAKIAGGKLVITGTTTAPSSWVRLDGQTDQSFNVKSDAEGAFAFGIVYHPGDCIVDLQKLISPTALGAATSALVADCGPAGVSPRGAWNPATAYVANDLVTHLGSTWRARRSNANTLPVSGVVWEQFAAAGEPAPMENAGGAAPAAAPDGPAGGDLAGNYPNPTIRTGAVTTLTIAQGAVNNLRLSNNSVTTGKILDGSVVGADIADGTLSGADVLNESLTAIDLATDSVNSAEIATNAVGATEITDDAIDSGEIADNSLFAADLASNSVGNSELADNAVGAANIINSSITGADVANNSLTTADIDGASINGAVNLNNVANGRCVQVDFSVPGSVVGEAVVIAMNGTVQNGIILYPQRVSSNGTVQANICNFTGTTMNAIVDLPVKIITFN